MKIGPLFWGICIYALISLASTAIGIYGFATNIAADIGQTILLVALCFAAGRTLRMWNWRDLLPYSFAWMVEAMVLDLVYTAPYIGFAVFSYPLQWLTYVLILVVPLLSAFFRAEPQIPAHLTT